MMAEAVANDRTHDYGSFQSSLSGKTGLRSDLDVGVFLNISPDHIGPIEHPTLRIISTTNVSS